MSYSVTYVVDMSGKAFNSALADERRAGEADFHNLVQAGSLWDGRLAHQQAEFSVELTGVVTILWLTTKYSRILADQEEKLKNNPIQ